MNEIVSTEVGKNKYDQYQIITSYDPQISPVSNFSFYDTGKDQEYYPGTLNTDNQGNRLLTATSTEEELQNSSIQTAHNMGVAHPLDIKPVWNDPDFPEEIASPMGMNTDNPTIPKDRSALLRAMDKRIKKDDNFDTSNIMGLSHPIDLKSFLPDLNPYSLMGDPRWSLGFAMQTVMQKVMPMINEYVKSVTPTAAYINDMGQFCDLDGNPVPVETLNNSAFTYDANGILDFSKTDFTKIKKPPTAQEIKKIFLQSKDEAFRKHADAFIKYLKDNYLNIPDRVISSESEPHKIVQLAWKAQPVYLKFAGMFFIKLTQEVVEKDPAREVILVDELTLTNGGRGQAGIDAKAKAMEEVIGTFETTVPQTGGDGRPVTKTQYFVYRYLGGYVEDEDPNPNTYNPYNSPPREDPDAPAPPARPAVYEKDPETGQQVLVSPAFPPGKPGMIETIDMNFLFKRYYPDQKDYISQQLGVEIEEANNIIADQKHLGALASLAEPIPDYLSMV